MVPWVQPASACCLLFYLLILGSTFTLGVLHLKGKGVFACVVYHALPDSPNGLSLVQSIFVPIACMVRPSAPSLLFSS